MTHIIDKRICFFLGISLFLSLDGHSQSEGQMTPDLDADGSVDGAEIQGFDASDRRTRGTPYMFEDWQPGSVIMNNGVEIKDLQLNYDLETQNIILKKSNTVVLQLNKAPIKNFQVGEGPGLRKYVKVTPGKAEGEKDIAFYEQLTNNGILLKKTRKFLKKADDKRAYAAGKSYDEYLEESFYFLENTETGAIQKIKMNNKSILKALGPSDKTVLDEFLQKNDFKVRDEASAIQLVSRLGN